MKNTLLPVCIIILIVLACAVQKNKVPLDEQIPPADQLIEVRAEDLADDYRLGKRRGSGFPKNDADEKYLDKWVKVTGTVKSFYDKGKGLGYTLSLEGFISEVSCIGNLPEDSRRTLPNEGQKAVIVGKVINGGPSNVLINPCKFL